MKNKIPELDSAERYCVQCEYKWEDAAEEYKLCPKCGAASVIRPSRINTGVKVLVIRNDLYRVLLPYFQEAQRTPEMMKSHCSDATEHALGVLLKKLCHY